MGPDYRFTAVRLLPDGLNCALKKWTDILSEGDIYVDENNLCETEERRVMKVSVDELVDRVKANMEELTDSFDAGIVMTAGIGVERYIREKMPDALLAVWATEPVSSLPLIDCASLLRPQRSSDGSGYVLFAR